MPTVTHFGSPDLTISGYSDTTLWGSCSPDWATASTLNNFNKALTPLTVKCTD